LLGDGGDPAPFHVDLRFDYFNQDQLRSGTRTVDRGRIVLPSDREIQQLTINRNYNLFLDYAPNPDWGVSAQIPYANRYHTTIAQGDEEVSTSQSKSLGDVRLIGRYRWLVADHGVGVQLGVKLATGRSTTISSRDRRKAKPSTAACNRGWARRTCLSACTRSAA
jgi:hypothetical protein